MTSNWTFIADCLRAELADYGELLRLFERQQNSLFSRDADAVLQTATDITIQVEAVARSRERREEAVADLARELGCDARTSLRGLLPHIEEHARPLLQALINEVNLLLYRVRRTTRQNHTLLKRSLEVQQEVLQHLQPQAYTKTYSPAGHVSVVTTQLPGSLRVAG